jgi:hypothetical protein
VRICHRGREGEARQDAGLAAQDTGQRWTKALLAGLGRVAGRALILEHGLAGGRIALRPGMSARQHHRAQHAAGEKAQELAARDRFALRTFRPFARNMGHEYLHCDAEESRWQLVASIAASALTGS